jgi:hypothetical protein
VGDKKGHFKIIEQNASEISETDLVFDFLSEGKLWVYRPVPAAWVWPASLQAEPTEWPTDLLKKF